MGNRKMTKTDLQIRLLQMGTHEEVITWLGERSLREFWRDCPRIDWLFEIAYKMMGEEDCPTDAAIRAASEAAWLASGAASWASWSSDAANRASETSWAENEATDEAKTFILKTIRESFLEAIGM